MRPCKLYDGVRTRFADTSVDIVIVRENTEDLYAGIEFERGSDGAHRIADAIGQTAGVRSRDDDGSSNNPNTEFGTRRCGQFGPGTARRHGTAQGTTRPAPRL